MFIVYFRILVVSLGLSIIIAFSPLALGLWILILSIRISFLVRLMFSSWFGFILFLIYIGGILVIFAYFVSIQPNQQFELKRSLMFSFLIFFRLVINNYVVTIDLISHINWWIDSLFNLSNLSIIVLLGFILFLALVIVVKITTFIMAPLRPYKV